MDYRKGGEEQNLIVGGIDITPFLSWIRDMPQELDYKIDFYYTVRTQDEALFLTEIFAAAQQHKNFRAHINYSAVDGRLTIEKMIKTTSGCMSRKHIYMCGPSAMVAAFQHEFRKLNVPSGFIHYEVFAFR